MSTTPKIPPAFGFYAILTDPVVGYERLAQICVDREVAFVQLRMKDAPAAEVLAVARKLMRIVEGSKSRLIINDDAAVAADAGAHGVHLGQSDMTYDQARRIVGDAAIVGISTHNPAQTLDACAMRPDYIGIGPVFPTPTKKIADPAIGITGMKEMLLLASVPAVALGSITCENLPEILRAGGRNFSMVRPVCQSNEPQKVIEQIQRITQDECAKR
jgi:thiamine-phosphate pyrophosphorylase